MGNVITKTKKNDIEYENFKLSGMDLGESVVVEKIFDKTFEGEGIYGTYYTTTLKYEGNEYKTLFSSTQNQSWLELPNGMVKITKCAEERKFNVKGKEIKKLVTFYKMESLEDNPEKKPDIKLFGETTNGLSSDEKKIIDLWKEKGNGDIRQLKSTLETYKETGMNIRDDITDEWINKIING
jgi:hypothetical protein